jgi:hypothetical protein
MAVFTALRNKAQGIHARITNLTDSLDPNNSRTSVKDPIAEITDIISEIHALIGIAKMKGTKNELNAAAIQIDSLKDRIDAKTNKFNVRIKDAN